MAEEGKVLFGTSTWCRGMPSSSTRAVYIRALAYTQVELCDVFCTSNFFTLQGSTDDMLHALLQASGKMLESGLPVFG